jgi:hypothetical protein
MFAFDVNLCPVTTASHLTQLSTSRLPVCCGQHGFGLVLETDGKHLVPDLGYMSGVPSSELRNFHMTHTEYPYSGLCCAYTGCGRKP